MSALRDRAGHALKNATKADGVKDALIATRDGLPALGDIQMGDMDTIAAMAAASLAAAESASLDMGAGRVAHLSAGCEGCNMLIGGLDDQYILVLISERDSDAQTAFKKARQELQTVLAE